MSNGYDRTFSKAYRAGLLFAMLALMGATLATAQELEVEGRVTSAGDGQPLPGVNVVEVGTQSGTTTGAEGRYALGVSSAEASLRFSFVGFQDTTVAVGGRSTIDVELRAEAQELEQVVVTALGIEREQRSLGYATSQVDAADLVEATEANPTELLRGQVPGVVVNTNAGGVASSSSLKIRGASSLTGSNEPLYVVDGVPIINETIGGGAGAAGASAGQFGGFDGGSALTIVNPANIESISVLKGAGASALYGSRALNGVVLIQTKSGRGATQEENFSVTYNSTVTGRSALEGFADYQSAYGQGFSGLPPGSQEAARSAGLQSWGAPLGSLDSSVVQFDGARRPYANVVDRAGFYRRGLSHKNTLSFNGAYENVSLRFSGSYLSSEDIVPSSGYEQLSTTLRGFGRFGNLSVDANVTYQNEDTNDRTYLNDPARNPNYVISFLPANVPKSALQPGFTEDGSELVFSNPFQTNPYFAVNKFDADDNRDRILGGVQASYDVASWLSVQARQGLDWSNLRRTTVDPFGTAFKPEGSMEEREYQRWESNTKLLATATPMLPAGFGVRVDAGGNLRQEQFELVGLRGQGFNVPGLETISNTGSPERLYAFSEKEVRSLFGSAAFSYRDFAFLTVTGRNDWSSTLPEANNSYFYPSVSGSFVFTDVLPTPDWLNFGKLRASWAEVGGDTGPYQLNLTYSLIGEHLGQALGNVTGVQVPNFGLLPEEAYETELGFETQFLGDRFGIDFTYYRRSTENQITSLSTSEASGYQSRVLNSGVVNNRGVEVLLTATPFATDDVRWDAGFNVAANNSEIESLAQELRTDAFSSGGTVTIVQKVGAPVSAIYGTPYVRDDQGRIVHGEDGLPLEGESRILGKGAPDWSAGLSNTLSFKNVYLNALLDVRWGGQLYSGTNATAYSVGLHKNTLTGRAECEAVKDVDPDTEEAGYPAGGCFRPDGVTGHFEEDEDGNQVLVIDSDTTAQVLPSEYYGNISSSIAEEFIYDANYVNLRQVRIGYRLPERWVARTPVQGATISLVGRNLLYLYDSVPNVNPGAEYNSASTPGLEFASLPEARSLGFDLQLTF